MPPAEFFLDWTPLVQYEVGMTAHTHGPSTARKPWHVIRQGLRAVILAGVACQGLPLAGQQETRHVRVRPIANRVELSALTAIAEMPPAVAQAMKNCIRVSGPAGGGVSYHGSGTFISPRHVATAKHVVEGMQAIYIDLDGKKYPARYVAGHSQADLCVLETTTDVPGIEGASLITEKVQPYNATLFCGGYDSGGFRSWQVSVIRYFHSPAIESRGGPRSGSIQGNSGCGVFTENGQLCSVLYANGGSAYDTMTGGGTVISTEPALTTRFLRPWTVHSQGPQQGSGPPSMVGQYNRSPRQLCPPGQNCPPSLPPVPKPDPCIHCPPGPKGDKGDKGDKGEPGDIPNIDYDLLVDLVLERLPPVILQPTYDSGGNLNPGR